MSKRRTYLHNAALLTGSGLVLRALGMGFRIVLAAYLGSEGMGLYQLILALYMVFVSFATAGVNVASARLAAQSLARGSGMAETLRGLCITALGFGTAAMLAQSVLAGPCARYAKVGRYVQLLGFVAPFMYLESMVDGVLKGLGEQLATFRYSLLDSVFRIAAIWLVVPQYGMMGFLGVMAVSNLMTCGLNMRRMMEQIKKPSP